MNENPTEKRYDDPNPFPTFALVVIGAILVTLMIVGLQAVYYRAQNAEDLRKIVAEAPEELQLLRLEQLDQLNGYRWVSGDTVAAIPIEIAMEKTAGRLNADRSAATAASGVRP
jgi:hypothetical protein